MPKFCPGEIRLVGPGHWLPVEPFEFTWDDNVGCNSLRCERCGEPVRTHLSAAVRHYSCACQRRDEDGIYYVNTDPSMVPEVYSLDYAEWVCAGHPDLVLPVTLDGVRLDGSTDWDALAVRAALSPPFEPPGVRDRHTVWIRRLYALLGAEADRLSRAVAGLLDAEDPRLVRAAYDLFHSWPRAAGFERIAASTRRRREWLAATPCPRSPASSLLESAAWLLDTVAIAGTGAGEPFHEPAFELAKDLALAGIGDRMMVYTAAEHDPRWLREHAADLVAANDRGWAASIARTVVRAPAPHREQVLRAIGFPADWSGG